MRHVTIVALLVLTTACRGTGSDTAFDSSITLPVEDADGDGISSDEDCDDANADVGPGADELCNGIDDDCDLQIDEDPVDASTFYTDADGDGFGDPDATVDGCEAPEGTAEAGGDCNDDDAAYNPDATEDDCSDPNDYNCDGSVGYVDEDGDGFAACEECNDASADVNPGAIELPYDGVDNDCDELTLDDDLDGDGVLGADDCDDTNAEVSPNAEETPYDGVDNDCDELTLDDDIDGDGFPGDQDCDDTNADVNPNAAEAPYDGLDNDCNPDTEDDDLDGDGFASDVDCDDADESINPSATEAAYDGIDNDCDPDTLDDDLDQDGFNGDVDCNDDSAEVNPDATEEPYDGLDNDCDTSTLDDDLDQDGFNADVDCNDDDASVNPDVAEQVYDGVDNDCDVSTLDDDLDQDGVNADADCNDDNDQMSPNLPETAYDGLDNDCDASTLDDDLDQDGFDNSDDCNDDDEDIRPDAAELCNGVDTDCSGTADDNEAVGQGASCTVASCQKLKDDGGASGEFWVDLSGEPMKVWCDQVTEGGGWTVMPPQLAGEWGDVTGYRDNKAEVLVYLRNVNGNIEYTLTKQMSTYSQHDVVVADHNAPANTSRLTWIPRSVAASRTRQGFNSNGTDIDFNNCDSNPNSYLQFHRPDASLPSSADGYGFDDRWRDTAKITSDTVPTSYFTGAEIHQGGCGVRAWSTQWEADDGTLDVAVAVK